MIKKIKNSIAFRSAKFYQYFLSIMPIYSKKKKEECDIFFLTLTGKKQINLLQESLLSIYRRSAFLPKIVIVTDGSITKIELLRKLKWYNNSISIIEKDDCLKFHIGINNLQLANYADKSVFGLKLAAIIQCLKSGSVISCDTDILWFKDILAILEKSEENGKRKNDFEIKMSLDYQIAYDLNIVDKFFSKLNTSPYFNSGVVFIKGNIFNQVDINTILEEAILQCNHFTEQTILAGINILTSNNYWKKDEIVAFQSDSQSLLPTYLNKNWYARHYVGPVRHLFWRDAFFLRIGYNK